MIVNVIFAVLYVMGGKGIAEMHPGSFLDGFRFSVETFATVGYGHMYLGLSLRPQHRYVRDHRRNIWNGRYHRSNLYPFFPADGAYTADYGGIHDTEFLSG